MAQAHTLFFFNQDDIEPCRNVHFTYGPVERLGGLIEPDTQADKGTASVFLGPVLRLGGGTCRIYYHT